jgi:hypothetical protein
MSSEMIELEIKTMLSAMKERRELESWQREIDMNYNSALRRYEGECELLRLQREQFYRDNPDAPPYMYMQVTAPPQKITIKII